MTNYDTFYGGIVYIYTNSSIEFWVPSLHGNIIYIDNLWGNGDFSYAEDTGKIRVKQFGFRPYERINCNDGKCSPIYDSDDLSAVECNCPNINFTGEFCQIPTCNDPPEYENSHIIYNEITNGSLAVYKCDESFAIESGDFVHYCEVPRWIGQSVVCTRTCPIPSSYIHSTRTYSGTIQGSLTVYSCEPGYARVSGDFVHLCDLSNWVGNFPICQGVCDMPPVYNLTTYMFNGTTNGSIAEYTCNNGHLHFSGDARHHCLPPNWIGAPVVCREKLTEEEVTELQDSVEEELHVDKKTTSSYKRRKISAHDPRLSSKQIGVAGVVIMIMCFLSLL
ncbi:CSMD [Mytilus coruscus]|uniref:CSMD n=1 Tax=Mytilus coruscus TaxID=42192 RepID=A0A6J8B402_MYTCO|nr:CSMD [Mytilus coruscus]